MQTLVRPAFTRLELVVAVVCALTALGLGLLALQRQREAGLRVQCIGNLKRIGEATLAYHEAQGTLPAARIAEGYATWAVQIAPHLSKDSPLLAWDLQQPAARQSAEVRQAVLPAYFCPARDRPAWVSNGDQPGAVGDYAAVCGDGDPAHPWTGLDANGPLVLGEVLEQRGDLVLRWRGRTRLADLPRGTSNTPLVGEKHVPWDGRNDPTAGDGPLYDGTLPLVSGRVGGPGFGLAADPTTPAGPLFGSAHRGLVAFVHADTSVHSVAVTIDESILGKLCRREP